MKALSRLHLLLFFLTIFVSPCHGDPEQKPQQGGYVAGIRGHAFTFDEQGQAQPLKKGDHLAVGSYVQTGKKSRIKISFRDRTVVTLGESTTIQLKDYTWSDSGENGRFNLKISEGFFRVIGGKITKKSPKQFIAETPVATIGIRGSSYAGQVSPGGLRVFLESGKGIDVYNRRGSVALLTPGRGTIVTSSETAPAAARLFQADEINQIFEGSAFAPGSSPSAGSILAPGAVISNSSTITNSVNIASGRNNRAEMGSIRISDSSVSGTVVNDSKVSDSVNLGAGVGNSAVMGSIDAE